MVHNEHNLGDKQRMHAELNITVLLFFHILLNTINIGIRIGWHSVENESRTGKVEGSWLGNHLQLT